MISNVTVRGCHPALLDNKEKFIHRFALRDLEKLGRVAILIFTQLSQKQI